MDRPAIRRVMVSGANSFYGASVIQLLLEHCIKVNGTVRSASTRDRLLTKYGDSVQVFVVRDITAPGAFDQAVKGCQGIFHIASPFSFTIEDTERDLLKPAIQGTLCALTAAAQEASVRRVVLTSSVAAILNPFAPGGFLRRGYNYTELDYNPVTREMAATVKGPQAYSASKALAERAAWDFMGSAQRHFDLVCINPAHTWGSYHQDISSPNQLNLTNSDLSKLMDGLFDHVPNATLPWMADINAVAQAHYNAMFMPGANGRYLIANSFFTFEKVVQIMYDNFADSEWISNVPKPATDRRPLTSIDCFTLDNSRSIKQLGIVYRPWRECIIDFCRQYPARKRSKG